MSQIWTLGSIRDLYHFTDRRNIESIRFQGGLLTTATLNVRRIGYTPAGNEQSLRLDQQCGMDHYVHLSFVPSHPLQYVAAAQGRVGETVVLRINRSVLQLQGVMYCAGVANAAAARPILLADAASMIDYEALYTFMDYRVPELQQRRKNAELSEVLVPNFVPIAFIENLPNG